MMLRVRIASAALKQTRREVRRAAKVLEDPRYLRERGRGDERIRHYASSTSNEYGTFNDPSSEPGPSIRPLPANKVSPKRSAAAASKGARSPEAASPEMLDARVAALPETQSPIQRSALSSSDDLSATKDIVWPREERYRFDEDSYPTEPESAHAHSTAKGKRPIRGDQDIRPDVSMEQKIEGRAQRRQKDLDVMRRALSTYRKRFKDPSLRQKGRQTQILFLEQILTTIRRPNASQFLDRPIRLGHYRQLLSKLALQVLDGLPEAALHRTSTQFDRFLEQCWRLEITAFQAGSTQACALLSGLNTEYVRLQQSSSDSRLAKGRGLRSAYDAIRSLFESTYAQGRDDVALNTVASHVLDCTAILGNVRWLTIQQRSRLYFYLRKIDAPLKVAQDAAARAGLHSKDVATVVNTLSAVMKRARRLYDAKRIVAWATANDVPMRLQVIESLAQTADQEDDKDTATSALSALRVQAKRQELELPRSTQRFLALRSAKSGMAAEVEDALAHIERLSTKRTAAIDVSFARRVRIALASAQADCNKVIELLAQKCDVNRVLPQDTHYKKDGSRSNTRLPPNLPSAYDCHLLLNAFLRADRPIEAVDILNNLLEMKCSLPQSTLNAFLTFYVRRNDVASALGIFRDHFYSPSTLHPVTINQMIRLFGRNNDIDSANKIVQLAQKHDVPLTRSIYSSLLQAHVEAKSWTGAMTLFRQLNEHAKLNLRPGFVEFSIMLHMHVLRPMPIQDTYAFLRYMLNAGFTPNAHTFTSLLLAAADAKLPDVLENVFTIAEQRLGGKDGRQKGKGANGFHFTVMIQYHLKQGDFDTAQTYLQEMIQRKEPISGVLRGIIVGAYAKAQGEGEDSSSIVASQLAESYVAESPKDFVEVYAPLIRRAASEGRADVIETLIRESTNRGLEIPLKIWSDLLDALRREGNAEGALQVWDLIFNKATAEVQALKDTHGIHDDAQSSDMVPSSRKNMLCVPLSAIIDALTYAGRHDEVASIWIRCREFGFGFDSHNWNHLVVALLQAGRVGDACNIIEKVLNSQPPYRRDRSLLDTELWRKRAGLRTKTETNNDQLPRFTGQAQTLFGDDAGDRTLDRESRRLRLESIPREPMDVAEMPYGLSQGDASMPSVDETIHNLVEQMLEPLEARSLMETVLSPWYAHFETMRVLHEITQTALQLNNGQIILRPPLPTQNRQADDSEQDIVGDQAGEVTEPTSDYITTVDKLLREHPRVAFLLRTFEQRLERLRELERTEQERDSLLAQSLS